MNFVADKSRLKYLLFSKVNNSHNRINTEKEMGEREIARKRRIWFPGATFHIMERGIRRQAIYEEEGDYQIFKAILEKCLEKYGCRLQAYCMMTNHFHLLLETSDVDVSKFMKQLANCYAIYFNKKHGYKGHLFEGRYKSCLVETDEYFLQTSRYKKIEQSVSIVGARRCSREARHAAIECAKEYATRDVTVISGMAKGVDSYAHTACIKSGGYTIAILANGLDICYPKEHDTLMEKIIETGVVLSEYPPGVQPSQYRFPRRNRLICAWSDEVVVIGAGHGSGALITAEYAKKYGRRVYIK